MGEEGEQLLRDLKLVLGEIFAQQDAAAESVVVRDGARANRLLFALETCLSHGLKPDAPPRGGLFARLLQLQGPPTAFDWVAGLPQCLPGTAPLVDGARALGGAAASGAARLRVFLRLALNDGQLHACVRALCWDAAATALYYRPDAVCRDAVLQAQFVTRLETLAVVRFELRVTKEVALDLARADYWQTADLRPGVPEQPPVVATAPVLPPPPAAEAAVSVDAAAPLAVAAVTTATPVHAESLQQPAEHHDNDDDPLEAVEDAASQAEELERERRALEEKLLSLGISL